jgi:hypothetical protein
VLLRHLVLGLVFAHWTQENKLGLILYKFGVEANALWVVPIALILALDILLVVVLPQAEAESLLAAPHFRVNLKPRIIGGDLKLVVARLLA